jgi:MFS family permease
MSYEHDTLRQEIQHWATRKFTVFAAVVSFSTALNGFLALQTSGVAVDWRIASCLFYLFFIPATLLTWLFGRFNMKIGTYLAVVEKSRWERGVAEFNNRSRKTVFGLNRIFAILYASMAAISVFVSFQSVGFQVAELYSNIACWTLFVVLSSSFVFSIYILYQHSYPVEEFTKTWEEVAEELNLYSDNKSEDEDRLENDSY